jgi:ribosomal protein L18
MGLGSGVDRKRREGAEVLKIKLEIAKQSDNRLSVRLSNELLSS